MPTPPKASGAEGRAAMPVEVQLASSSAALPPAAAFRRWAESALQGAVGEVCVRVVDREESQALNEQYRGVQAPTNVLSFPAGDFPTNGGMLDGAPPLGDVVVCAPVVEMEARRQAKNLAGHYAHMVVHGVLHLRGHDHAKDQEAEDMEQLEAAILRELGVTAPWPP